MSVVSRLRTVPSRLSRRGRRDRDRAKEVSTPPAMTVSTPETPVKADFRRDISRSYLWSTQLCDGKIKIRVWIRFVIQCVVPPLAVVPVETAVLHDGAKVLTVSRFDWRDSSCSM